MDVEDTQTNGAPASQEDQITNNQEMINADLNEDVGNSVESSNNENAVDADTDGKDEAIAENDDKNNNTVTEDDLHQDGSNEDGKEGVLVVRDDENDNGDEGRKEEIEAEVEKQEENEDEQTNGTDERPASAPGPLHVNPDIIQPESENNTQPPPPPSQPAHDQQENGDGDDSAKAPPSPVGTTASTTLQVKSAVRKHTTTPADDSGLAQPLLPAIPRGQAKVQQIASSISDARKKERTGQSSMYPTRNRVPPKLVRLATVTVSPANEMPTGSVLAPSLTVSTSFNRAYKYRWEESLKISRPAPHGPSLYYEEPRRPQKVITWDQAHNARPPLRVDMEGPGPCSYSPLNKPLNETNAPSYTFGTKCFPEKPSGVGSRTSWAKSWFQSSHPYHSKADYGREGLWPSPTHYPKPKTLGARQRTMHEAPSYTFGHKCEFSIVRPGAHKEPSPTDYERQNADGQILRRGPSFSHQFRREGTVLWGCTESNPGPAAYTPAVRHRLQKPSFTIQGIRRSKSHLLGPFSSM